MGDRNNPIKFGPEWLRNLARERNAGSASNNQSGAGASPGIDAQSGAATAMQSTGIAHNTPKVLLAKLRYGREEMLALYDRSAEAPPELVYNDALYQPRGNPPIALMNTFEGEVREPVRSGPPMGGLSTGDRFGVSRGLSQGSIVEGRGRGRQPFVRQTSVGNKRPGSNTNWRQSRDEDEWRNNDSSRQRSMHSDKWDRDWGDRPNTDKPQSSWNTNRRTWVGGDEDNLPEWAVDNAEACGGTFDSSGAFHGYSNDDTNLPKQDASYQLTRSHTHDSFVRSKPAEEGSEEWWASEKANKLSPNRFDAVEIKFKETSTSSDGRKTSMLGSSGLDTRTSSSKDNLPPNKVQDKQDVITPSQGQSDGSTSLEDTFDRKAVRFAESKTFDALMRSDINLDEANDEGGNFQSVMITPNNSLRQKHQNIVAHQNYAASVDNATNQQKRKSGILQILQNVTSDKESQSGHTQQSQEDRVVENIMELTLKDRNIKEMPLKQPQTSDSLLMNPPACLSSVLASRSQRQMLPVHPSQLDANKMMPTPNMGLQGVQSLGSQYLGMDYMALNAALGFRPLGPAGETVGGPVGIQSVPPPVLPGSGLMSGAVPMPGFPNASPSPMPSNAGANLNAFGQMVNAQAQQPSEISMPNLGGQAYMFPTHCLQPSGSQNEFGSSIYSNIMQHPPTSNAQTPNSLADQWYYEDPKKNIQGPFSSRDMYNWYQAGFFTPSLMVRRATDTMMRPLGSYGPSVPFAQMDILSSFPMASGFEVRNQGPQERIINSHQELGLDVQDALWNQTTSAPNFMWMQQAINARKENLPMFFWDQQPPAMASNSLRPEMMPKDIKSEDEILAQIRAPQNNPNTSQNEILAQLRAPQNNPNTSQNEILAQLRAPQNNPNTSQNEILAQLRAPQNNPNTSQNEILAQLRAPQNNPNTSQNEILAQLRAPQNNPNTSQSLYYVKEPPNTGSTAIKEDNFRQPNLAMALTVEKLEKQMQEKQPLPAQAMIKMPAAQLLQKQFTDVLPTSSFNQIPQQLIQSKESTNAKVTKLPKVENEKAKIKDCPVTKNESNKSKEDKKEEITDTKTIENDVKIQKRSSEASTVKNKKEDKATKKELMKERKEWVKEGFTIVKEKKPESKKAKEDILLLLMAGETERRRQDEENRVAEEMKLKSLESYKDYQETPKQQQRQQQADLVTRKAPWSAMANLTLQDTTQEGLTLAEIQQLEREKKLQQIKEQQQMIQIITQQHAAALAREQEAQASLGWIKKKGSMNMAAQTLAEIQADARKQSMAAAAAAQVQEEPLVPPTTNVSWTKSSNGAGFWDTQLASARVPEEPANVNLGKTKKKVKVTPPVKKEPSPSADFEAWCMTALISWSTKIDVPTFVGFLKDIESPYEVKDYVKCYLGESRDSSDFAHQFLERRSKMLRVGLVTPPDDLCSPAMAINPRSNSTSDYQELKGKAKKPKKNKMLKVDARILGFSVTAAEDRINVGDIDTA